MPISRAEGLGGAVSHAGDPGQCLGGGRTFWI